MTTIGINGFGRIGRLTLRAIKQLHGKDLEVVAVNDLTDVKTSAHLFKYDSTYGVYPGTVEAKGDTIVVDGRAIKVLAEREPEKLPWRELGAEIILESTGIFTGIPDVLRHLDAGAKKVILTARYKGTAANAVMVNMGVNQDDYNPDQHQLISMASCTTNSLTPLMKVLLDNLGIEKALMTTIHSYTNDQRILDFGHKDLRRARAAALSIIPTTTNAAVAVTEVIPALKGKFDGMSMRVPTPAGSLSDVTAIVGRDTTAEEVNSLLKKASENEMKGILGYTEEPLVSRDIVGTTYSAIVDALSTRVMDGNMVKVLTWYDNEWAYSARIADLAIYIASKGL